MKRKIISVIGLFILVFSSGCTSKTKFDNLKISKIESIWREGFGPFPRDFKRTFDFENNTIFDTLAVDLEYVDLDYLVEIGNLTEEQKNEYNNSKTITTFEEEQEKKFVKKIKSLGIYSWKDQYITNQTISDGGNKYLRIYFTDGTIKSTHFYYKYPSTYNKVCNAFETYFGVDMYL